MSEVKTFKRFPAMRCWINHILTGNYSEDEKSVYTIFGKVKRVRFTSSIISKREIIQNQPANDDFEENDQDDLNLRMEFDLDDGTGTIRATLWGVDPENYKEINPGDIVDVVGLIRKWNNYFNLSPEIIKKIEDPNIILLRNAEIIKRIRSGDIKEIPDIDAPEFGLGEIHDEIDIDDLFEDENDLDSDDIKETVYSLVKQSSSEGVGITLSKLTELVQISDDVLRTNLRELEMESRIYQSEEGNYQAYQ